MDMTVVHILFKWTIMATIVATLLQQCAPLKTITCIINYCKNLKSLLLYGHYSTISLSQNNGDWVHLDEKVFGEK